jgi:hypothetical protein
MFLKGICILFGFFSSIIFANENIQLIDLNTEFAEIGRSGFWGPDNPVEEMRHSNVVELENDYIYVTNDQTKRLRPFLLNKQSGSVSLLKDFIGDLDKPYASASTLIFQANAKQALFNIQLDYTGNSNWYITDGSQIGTRKWNYPFRWKPREMRSLGQSEVLYHDGFKLYRYNESSQERVELTSIRPERIIKDIGRFILVQSIDSNKYILTDGTIEGTTDHIFKSIFIPEQNYHLLSDEEKPPVWAVIETNAGDTLVKIDGELGVVSMLNITNIPNPVSDEPALDTRYGIQESANYLYFRNRTGHLYQYNKVTNEFKIAGVSELSSSSYDIIGAHADFVLIRKSTTGLKLENITKFSFEKNELEFLLPRLYPQPGLYRFVEIVAEDEQYIYFYTYSFSNLLPAKDNALVRLDKRTFTSQKLSSRIGHIAEDRTNTELLYIEVDPGDHQNNSFDRRNLFANDGRLYFLANNPLPGVYRTDNNFTKLEGVGPSFISNDTQPSNISALHKISDGWLAWSANLKTLYKIEPNGLTKSFALPEVSSIGTMRFFEDGSNIYLQNSNRKINVLNKQTMNIDVLHSEQDPLSPEITKAEILLIKDGNLYIQSENSESLFVYSTSNASITTLKLGYSNARLFECSDRIFGFTGIQSNFDNSFLVSGSIFFELYPEVNLLSLPGDNVDVRFIDLDASKDGYIVLSSFTDSYLMNCATLEKEILVSTEIGGPGLPEFSYSRFEQKYYFVEDFILKTVSILTGDIEPLFEVRDFRIASSLTFTANGAYFPLNSNSLESDSLFKISSDSLQKVAKLHSKSRNKYFSYRTVSESGRFIFGNYSEYSLSAENANDVTGMELLVLDTLLDQLHFVELYLGPEYGVDTLSSGGPFMLENDGLLLLVGDNVMYKGEAMLLETSCVIESLCSAQFSQREPNISDGTSLFYEIGQNVWLPYRAIDQDLDTLNYQLIGHPSWLKIDETTGLITGEVPSNAIKQYDGIKVRVFDGTFSVDSQSFTFIIDDIEQSSSNGSNNPPVIPSSIPASSNESGGGSLGLSIFLLAIMLFMDRNKRGQNDLRGQVR